jgi:molybdopterin molybdotransferase
MISVDLACERLRDAASLREPNRVSLDDALGRVLAEPVTVDRDSPPTDRSAMDGFAVRAADVTTAGAILRIIGEVPAGQPSDETVRAGTTLRIYTGGVVPNGANTVVMVEDTTLLDDPDTVRIGKTVPEGLHVRHQGSDRRAGEPLLAVGRRIGEPEIAALATVGVCSPLVFRAPRIVVLSTGDEIVDPATLPAPHQVRNGNSPMLAAWGRRRGYEVEQIGRVEDDRSALAVALKRGLDADLFLITGGVSVGDYDFVADSLKRLAVRELFHGVAMRPGKPVFAGLGPNGIVLGLPGNPVSAFTGMMILGRTVLDAMEGSDAAASYRAEARLSAALHVKPGRQTYHLARVTAAAGGGLVATPALSAGSGDVLSLERSNAFVVTGADGHVPEVGSMVSVRFWDSFDPRVVATDNPLT